LLIFISCGESKKEKEDRLKREQIEKEEIEQLLRNDKVEKKTVKILITYNDAIAKHKKAVNSVYESARFFNLSEMDLKMNKGFNWEQKGWDTLRVYYKIDCLEKSFKTEFGEDDFNVLRLKIDQNWEEKIH